MQMSRYCACMPGLRFPSASVIAFFVFRTIRFGSGVVYIVMVDY
jgi:hypothetical protein